MNALQLITTAKALVANYKGLLAMDESTPTCNKRFAALNIPQTFESRRAYRELLVTTSGLGESISGVILYDETIRQNTRDGTSFLDVLVAAGILPGIKVDTGATNLALHPNEKVTEGLDGLRDRLKEYSLMGARFAKWRAVLMIEAGTPSRSCIEVNAQALARYAALCQEAGLVPIVEPEVLMTGNHSLELCRKVTEEVLRNVFIQLNCQRVLLEGIVLKPNMILPGLTCPLKQGVQEVGVGEQQYQIRLTDKQATDCQNMEEVADVTVRSLLRVVPAAVPGIAFLSGGQSPELASARLNLMNLRFKAKLPWELSFSFARAIQEPVLRTWKGQDLNVKAAQQVLLHRAKCNQAARQGIYTEELDQ